MKNLAKGGVLLTLLALITVFLYSQTHVLAAFFSPENIEVNQQIGFNQQDENKSELVETTEEVKTEVEEVESEDSENNETASKAMSFTATCYCLKGQTASGAMVRRGIVAADPRVLPLGTRISISGSSHSGTYLVADTGGVIKGRIIDIWVPSCAEAIRFGRRKMTVTILGKGGKKASNTKNKVKTAVKKVVKTEVIKEPN
jgi:3D (Asp-Asp-Asp) domain-containing protein